MTSSSLTNLELAAIIGIILVAAVVRIWWNDVARYSPADETIYAGYTRHLLERGVVQGYPEITASFINDRSMWIYPNPLRWGYLALAAASASVYGSAEPRALAWLSTVAGILVVPAVFMLGLFLFGARTGLLAAAFTTFSSIELAMGRRALQDEVFCLAAFVAVALFLVTLEKESRRPGDALIPSREACPERSRRVGEGSKDALQSRILRPLAHAWGDGWGLIVAFIVAATIALAVKESFLFLYPGLLAVVFVYRKPRHLITLALPPLCWFGVFAVLARSGGDFVRILHILSSAATAPYAMQYQAGPPHRPLFDFFATAPLVSILAVLALRNTKERRHRALVLFLVITIAIFGVIPSKNLRFAMVVDPFVRLLAASAIATLPAYALVAFAAANATIELELFYVIFIRGAVYDPVTQQLFESLAALPRDKPELNGRMFFPWICALIAAAAWGWSKVRLRATHPGRQPGGR